MERYLKAAWRRYKNSKNHKKVDITVALARAFLDSLLNLKSREPNLKIVGVILTVLYYCVMMSIY